MAATDTDDDLDPQAAGQDSGQDSDHDGDTMEIDLADDPHEPGVKHNPDGSAELEIDPGTEQPAAGDFYDNLVETLDTAEVASLGANLSELTDLDKTAHEKRIASYADALKRSGLDGNPTVGADFAGASKAVHPMLQEAAVDFMSSAIRELMPMGGPDSGPVKYQVIGTPTQSKLDKSVRKSQHMNWQLTKQMGSFRDTLEELLTQLPFGGRQYLKLFHNKAKNRPEEIFVPMDEVWLPSSASSFAAAKRYTHAQRVDQLTLEERMDSGMYRQLDLIAPAEPDTSQVQKATDDIAGKTRDGQNEDGDRLLREIYVWLELDSDPESQGALAPYIVTIDDDSQQVLSIYRDWDPEDPNREALIHLVEWGFIPWRGGPIGLPQLIGGLSIAATGSLNALLDAAHISNLQSAVKLKGGKGTGNKNLTVSPGTISEIDAPMGVDDIRKAVMQLPLPPPSPVLFQLLGFLVDAGKGVVNVALEKMTEAQPDMPVGTTLALIEQGSKVYAAIHARLHRSMERTLKGLHQLNKFNLDEVALAREAGEVLAKRSDYAGAMDVAPVSDPNIFSEAQRFAQIQAVAARAMGNPLYDARKVEEKILERLKIPDAENLLVPKPEPKRLNPVNENVAACQGAPLIAFPDQDHVAHLQTHIDFLLNPMFGQNPLLQPVLIPGMLQHIKDHMVYAYVSQIVATTSDAAGHPIAKLMDDDEDVSKEMDNLLAKASSNWLSGAVEFFDHVMPPPPPPAPPMPQDPNQPQLPGMPPQAPQAPQAPSQLLQMLQQMQAVMRQFQPQPPMDPSQVAAQDVQRKGQADQMNAKAQSDANALAAQKIQLDAQKVQLLQNEQQIEAQQTAIESEREGRLQQAKLESDHILNAADNATHERIAQAGNDVKERVNSADNMTALTIAQGEIESGERVALKTGTGINPGAER